MLQERKYIIIQSQDEKRFDLASEEDGTRHLVVRNGDHLII